MIYSKRSCKCYCLSSLELGCDYMYVIGLLYIMYNRPTVHEGTFQFQFTFCTVSQPHTELNRQSGNPIYFVLFNLFNALQVSVHVSLR